MEHLEESELSQKSLKKASALGVLVVGTVLLVGAVQLNKSKSSSIGAEFIPVRVATVFPSGREYERAYVESFDGKIYQVTENRPGTYTGKGDYHMIKGENILVNSGNRFRLFWENLGIVK